jgi:hypothetical protein
LLRCDNQGLFAARGFFFAMTAICPGFGLGKALNSPKFSR